MSTKTSKNVVNTGQYRKCFNHQILEMPSTLSTISATVVDKEFSGAKYRICSVDGNMHRMTFLTYKLWDLILLKLTEVVSHRSGKGYQWDRYETWYIDLSIKTIVDCLGLSTRVDALVHLNDRIIAAANVLQNIRVTVTKGLNTTKIDGYLSDVAVRDCSNTQAHSMTKSNALFSFIINPELIAYIVEQPVAIYHFNHCWLHLENSQNAYAAAKRLGRHYSQNTHSHGAKKRSVTMDIETLRNSLPCLNNKVEKDNRLALDNALKSIPGLIYSYINDSQKLTFEALAKLQLRSGKYNKVRIDISYGDHPNTSGNKTTTDYIKKMNDDALYGGHRFYDLDAADTLINRKGAIKQKSEIPIYAIPPDLTCPPAAGCYCSNLDESDDPENADDVVSDEVRSVVDVAPHISPFSR
jgi:hypothetical protein